METKQNPHPSFIKELSKMTCGQARKFIKKLGLGITRSQQSELIRMAACKKNDKAI